MAADQVEASETLGEKGAKKEGGKYGIQLNAYTKFSLRR